MFGILGESDSDVASLKIIVRRLKKDNAVPIMVHGCGGCEELLRNGAKRLLAFAESGCTKYIVCCDVDGGNPIAKHQQVLKKVVSSARLQTRCCIVIPVQELEAWLLADIPAVSKVCTGWRPKHIDHPEQITSPKEHLEKLSRDSKRRRRYNHAIHNEQLAKYINLKTVSKKCPSFRPLEQFVQSQ